MLANTIDELKQPSGYRPVGCCNLQSADCVPGVWWSDAIRSKAGVRFLGCAIPMHHQVDWAPLEPLYDAVYGQNGMHLGAERKFHDNL